MDGETAKPAMSEKERRKLSYEQARVGAKKASEGLDSLSIALLPLHAMSIGQGKDLTMQVFVGETSFATFDAVPFIQDVTSVGHFFRKDEEDEEAAASGKSEDDKLLDLAMELHAIATVSAIYAVQTASGARADDKDDYPERMWQGAKEEVRKEFLSAAASILRRLQKPPSTSTSTCAERSEALGRGEDERASRG